MSPAKVTILIPHYKTLTITKLCLRLLRKHTPAELAKVIVVDNDSRDESLDYLRTLHWIQLIERKSVPGESPAASHSHALDSALSQVTTPYVLSIHTDTLVKRGDWLPYLLSHIEDQPAVAGVGSWKLESKPLIKRLAKQLERAAQTCYYKLSDKHKHRIEGLDDNYYYLRSHCALYRMDLIRELKTGFGDGDAVAGKTMYKRLADAGYRMIFLPPEEAGQYLDHINHATMVLNPELGARNRTIKEGAKRIEQRLKSVNADQVLADASLDQ